MWQCPNCGCSFKNREQSHFCGEAPKPVEEYISRQPEAVEAFAARLEGYHSSKGSIRLPLELIAEIAQWCDA